jgi:prepilin-type N-terminal cleavage/methylation domain-containing protein
MHSNRQRPPSAFAAFSLPELLVVAVILAVVFAIAAPGQMAIRQRHQATQILGDLHLLDHALRVWALEHRRDAGAIAQFEDLRPYLDPESTLFRSGADALGNSFGTHFTVGEGPKVPASIADPPTG